MPSRLRTALATIVVVALPLILIGNALWLLLWPWFVDFQYALPGFPDAATVEEPLRTDLAKTGVDSIRPGGEGVELLREASLADGRPAFDAREISHMEDVRSVVAGVLIAWGAALLAALAAGAALYRTAGRAALRPALRRGALLTMAAIILVGLFMLISFEAFFDAFHGVFFSGDSWRFPAGSTLLELYPEVFWAIAGAAIAVLVTLQAGLLLALTRREARRGRPDQSTRPASPVS